MKDTKLFIKRSEEVKNLTEKDYNSKNKKVINEYPNDDQKRTIEDYSQAKEFLKVLSSEIGVLVEQLLGSIYDEKVAEKFADSIAIIYQKLKSEGLSEETVERIVIEYSSNIDKIVSVMKKSE